MIEQTEIYVDTSYLLASFYNSWEAGARAQLEVDLPEVVSLLGRMVERQLHQKVHRQLWYDGVPESGPHRYQRSLRGCNGVLFRAGQLIEWGDRRTQKAVDTRLVADMVLAGVNGSCSDMVLVSGDADMIPGIEEASARGIRTHLYGFGWDTMSNALRYACDTSTTLDPRVDFGDCMQISVLEGPLPPTISAQIEETAEEENTPETGETECTEMCMDEQWETSPDSEKEITTPEAPENHEQASDEESETGVQEEENASTPHTIPKPSMMAPRRRVRSQYIPLPGEIWVNSGMQTAFDIGQQYASWWFDNLANREQRDNAHILSGGGLPPEIDRPLLLFACETLHQYTLSETERVSLRDGFHSGIRGVLLREKN